MLLANGVCGVYFVTLLWHLAAAWFCNPCELSQATTVLSHGSFWWRVALVNAEDSKCITVELLKPLLFYFSRISGFLGNHVVYCKSTSVCPLLPFW